MKMMLSLFVLTVLCSHALSSTTETNSLVSSSSSSLWKRKDSILPNGASIHSKNGQYTLTMNRATCQLIVKKKTGKILWSSPKTKKRNCYAILRGNSNFEIMSGKITVWSNNTANKEKGKGPYRLTLDNKGNPIVKNNRMKCAWALFGCPVSKRKLRKIKRAPPKKQFELIKKLMKKQAKKRKGLPIKQLPVAKGAPKIKNQLPKILKRKTPPKKPKKKLLIKKSKARKLKKLLKRKGTGAIRKLAKSLKGKVPKKQLKKLKKLVKRGASWKKMKRIAMRKLKQKEKKMKRKIKNKKRSKPKKPKIPKTKRQLVKQIKKLTWMQKIKRAIMRRERPWKIKRMMKRLGNVRGNVRFWSKMTQMIRSRNWNQVARLIALPARQKQIEFRRPKRWVTRYRYQRYYQRWRTWYWRRTYRRYWARHCWRVWWWTRCRNYLRTQWYNYRYYYWTGAWRYRYVSYRRLE